jgi:glycosyltransferase involved in cell wall biosynthesis
MRIAYITPYQGTTLLKARPIVRNRSMSNRIKIELIASLLHAKGHDVEVFSQGEVIERKWKFYPAFMEPERFHPEIPVYYASVLPVRRLNGSWSNYHTVHEFKIRHRANPFDLVIIFNLKGPQIACADHAIRQLDIPVILEYEDDRFVNVQGQMHESFSSRRYARAAAELLQRVAGGIGVSPHLLSQFPAAIPQLLLRGVVGEDVITASKERQEQKKNIVLFSGTHIQSNGVAELIQGWRLMQLPGWELHITGYGGLTESLRQMAADIPGITFHGLVSRTDLVDMMSSARICINPHQVSETPGNVFAFKIIEYIAAGAHVITTPMGALEPDLEAGITYMPDNSPATIAAAIQKLARDPKGLRTSAEAAHRVYGPEAVSQSLDDLVRKMRPAADGQRLGRRGVVAVEA